MMKDKDVKMGTVTSTDPHHGLLRQTGNVLKGFSQKTLVRKYKDLPSLLVRANVQRVKEN